MARGSEAIRAYKKALKDGETFDRRVPLMIVGQDRSGKTSLKKSLKGEPFNPNEESTIGIEVDRSLHQITTEEWKNMSPDENMTVETSYEDHLAMVAVKTLEQQLRKETQEEGMSDTAVMHTVPEQSSSQEYQKMRIHSNEPLAGHKKERVSLGKTQQSRKGSQKIGIHSNKQLAGHKENASQGKESVSLGKTQQSKKGSQNIPYPEDSSIVLEKMQKIAAEGGAMKDDPIDFILWDFAGQSVFYATHLLFMSKIAMYVLTHNLSNGLHCKAVPKVKQGKDECIVDPKCEATNMDYLHYWLSAVHALGSSSTSNSEPLPSELPAVVLVCTHADKPASGTNPEEVGKDILTNLKGTPYKNHLVKEFFTVDNTRSQKSEEENIKQLCHLILQLAQQLPHLKKLIPLK